MKKYAIGLYEKAMPSTLSWQEMFDTARDCGYDFLEISIDESDMRQARLDWSDEQIEEVLAASKKAGIPVSSMCLSGHRKWPLGSPEQSARGLIIMEKALDLAVKLGVRIIQLAGYDVYYEESSDETKALFAKNLKKAAEMAAVKGVSLGFETMETDFMDTVWKSMYYVQMVNSPWLGVYPDSGNLTNASKLYKTDVLEDLKSGAGHIMALHLKETIPGHYREIPFLTGHVDFEAVIDTAWKLGVRRYVTEMWDTGKESWLEDIQFANASMTRILDTHQ